MFRMNSMFGKMVATVVLVAGVQAASHAQTTVTMVSASGGVMTNRGIVNFIINANNRFGVNGRIEIGSPDGRYFGNVTSITPMPNGQALLESEGKYWNTPDPNVYSTVRARILVQQVRPRGQFAFQFLEAASNHSLMASSLAPNGALQLLPCLGGNVSVTSFATR